MERPKTLRVLMAIVVLASAAAAMPVDLRCEYLENPLGIDAASPHLSWQSDSAERNWKQSALDWVDDTGRTLVFCGGSRLLPLDEAGSPASAPGCGTASAARMQPRIARIVLGQTSLGRLRCLAGLATVAGFFGQLLLQCE